MRLKQVVSASFSGSAPDGPSIDGGRRPALRPASSALSSLRALVVLSWLVVGCGGAAHAPARPETRVALPEEAAPVRDKPAASALVREAEALLAKGDPASAKLKLLRAIEEDEKDARAYLTLGLAEEALENVAAAEQAYRQAIEADASLAEAYNNLGLILRDAGRDDEALAALAKAVELDPRLASAHANLAMAYEEAGRIEEARAAYERAVKLAPDDAMLFANHGLFLLSLDDSEGAARSLRVALAQGEGDRAVLLAVGNGLRRAGYPDEAIRAMRAAIAAEDGKPTPALLSELALAQLAAQDPDGATKSLRDALALDDKYATGHYVLAGVLAVKGDFRGAMKHYRRCIELDPRGPLAARAKQKLQAAKDAHSGAPRK